MTNNNTNNTNNFKFNDILDGIVSQELTLIEATISLEKIGNSYARNIAHRLTEGAFEEAIALLKQSCAFERKLNSIQTTAIILTEEEILARRDNLILINGMTFEEATALAYRRASRLANGGLTKYTSIQSGTFLC